MNKRKAVIKNALFGFGGQFLVMLVGIIVPRMIMSGYGSEMNGLLATLGQIFVFIALLGAGVNQSSVNALYPPIKNSDHDAVSGIISVTQRYFNRVAAYYGICVLLFSAVGPFILKTSIDKTEVFLIILLEGAASVISLRFIESYNALLTADGRGYFISAVSLVNKLAVYLMKIVLSLMGVDILYLQAFGIVIALLRVVIYRQYMKKHYGWLIIKKADNAPPLRDRNSFLVTQIAWTVFSSTDMIILSVFLSAEFASVYNVYNMIFANLALLLNEVYANVSFLLGRTYNENIQEYEKYHDAYYSVFLGAMTIMMCVSTVMCLPFVRLYTRGINDINYIYPALPVLFSLVQLLSWSRYVPGNLTGLAGYAKKTSYISVMEAVINIIASLILVHFFGIYGVVAGTVIALPIKVVWCIYISDKKVIRRSYLKTVKILLANYLLFGCAVLTEKLIDFRINGFGTFLMWSAICLAAFTFMGAVLNIIANPKMLKYVKTIISQRKIQGNN
ncbi:polysaccharide biosynthesis C-terminal domain-containing protein [uncultured Ruminococcus sp.]|uniref:polysaccharide biosynthesis C-terminal domain-containing protein n=1 Tax=uncultured Ruminococcus sp. TaxID=165186 RepID=UPI0026359C21|nr:polysaccharide biosynthesis C-terminal domain-containing protein [uncultured Ruminococcus sp.]